ncbi:hypothetical protein HDV06_001517 [Boothiomyces sp. JEL0866]|nr:hypothetical protein HDV06_001517 [Boothiomyces sp. JEL0866]
MARDELVEIENRIDHLHLPLRVFVQDQLDMQLVPKLCTIKRNGENLVVDDYFLHTDELQSGDELVSFEGYIEKYPFQCFILDSMNTLGKSVIVKTTKMMNLNSVYEIKGKIIDDNISPEGYKELDLDYTVLKDILFELGKQGELLYYSLFTDLSCKIVTDNKDFVKKLLPIMVHSIDIEGLNKKSIQPKKQETMEYSVLQHKQILFDDSLTEGKLNEIGYKNIKLIEKVLGDCQVDYDIPFTEFKQKIKPIIISNSKMFKTHLQVEIQTNVDFEPRDLYSEKVDVKQVDMDEKSIQEEFIEMQKQKRRDGLQVDDGSLFQVQLKLAESIARDQEKDLDLDVFRYAVSLLN